jgi:uncharacterized protein YndB with AHSA1/START domain
MSFQISLEINRSPADVFKFVTDFRNMPKWYEAVERVTVTTSGPSGIGTRFHMIRSLPGGPAHNDVEVISYRVDEEVALASINGPTPFQYRYRFEPTTNGTTLTLNGEITGEGLPGPVARVGGLGSQLFKHGMKKNLQALKAILDS